MPNSNNKRMGINEMSAITTMIANGELEKLRLALLDKTLKELELDYLLDLAQLKNNPEITKLLKQHADTSFRF
ncbi:hypothetical protein A3715_11515 [Oleiphilus sp. HI0009]|uniref:hypothetical protein n=1 Tax=unclassified Oleiphilus TaxID=2631174 RepID=UPI0007C30351|nr:MULTISPECIES: hypothetical protein [unclassified Oleiphilus]KZX77099.1 hypothetical protein A3715_11515 [Oleiphilus sp. HI0009]MCH2159949.1 hypothetical protein [Oleiphilaceae bacterium]KZY61305.1 hypothetical protein A3738_14170 [Oleiphilus sp. HI0066]KZY71863.1 hypothetical protein A3738_23535 [Oleiphilus sp. HI0066]KZY72844.1 hypothetical protein A3739_15565 [Oleiphilus sp. HI0067]